jgi:hypothetical protein
MNGGRCRGLPARTRVAVQKERGERREWDQQDERGPAHTRR